MAWKDTLLQGSFRGASFQVESHSAGGGRRGQLHEYPQRDTPWFEDLGRKTREFSVEAFIIGDNYHLARAALQAACETEGAGTLVHPYLGSKQVVCTAYSLSERIDEGRLCRFSMTFAEAGTQQFPLMGTDFGFQINSLAGLSEVSMLEDFVRGYTTQGMPGFVFGSTEALAGNLASILSGFGAGGDFGDAITSYLADITGLSRFPSLFGQRTIDLVGAYRTSAITSTTDTAGAAIAQKNLASLSAFSSASEVAVINQTTPSRVAQAGNMEAFSALVRQASLTGEARTIKLLQFDSYQAANAYSRNYISRMDAEMLGAGMDAAYLPLNKLTSTVVADLAQRAGTLPQITSVTLQETTPSLVLANNLYGDATRADDIAARNGVRHPSFMPTGTALEVLAS